MADEQFEVEFVASVNSYEKGVEALVRSHARLAERFDRTSREGDRLEKQMLKVGGSEERTARQADTLARSTANLNNSLITQRYALYDVASTYGLIGASLLAADGYAIKVAADFESAFTSVERTSEGSVNQIEALRGRLVDLSTQIPLTFQDLSEIASLGNQLGIEAANIESFTETVARFSAITGISAEQTAQAFGLLANILDVPEAQFENLGSSIALVARTSRTTEQQIIALAQRLGSTATRAGFTADQVIGLAGALGSLGVAPERAQGVFETYFNTLNESLAEGGEKLEFFAQVVGLTTSQVDGLVRSGQGFEVFQRFISALDGADTVELTSALQELGLTGLRVNEVIPRLAGNMDVLKDAFDNASTGFEEGTELQRQFGLVADDLNSKFMQLVSAINALIEAASGGAVSGLAGLLQILIDITNSIRAFVETPVGQRVATIIAVFSLLGGILLTLAAANALATASAYALLTAQSALGTSGAFSGIRLLIGAMLGYTATTNGATVSTLTFGAAMRTILGPIAVALTGIQVLSSELQDYGGIAEEAGRATREALGDDIGGLDVKGVGADFEDLTQILVNIIAPAGQAIQTLRQLVSLLQGDVVSAFKGSGAPVASTFGITKNLSALVPKNIAGDNGTSLTIEKNAKATDDWSASLDKLGGAGGGASRQVRTLLDYASDLAQIIDRSFEIRFGSQSALDQVTTSWMDLNEQIDEYRRKVLELTADRAIQSYFLSVAEAYGDTLRAGELRSNIADIDAELADATANASTELNGNSKAAILNRKRITDLIAGYGDYIEALAAGGADQATLNAAVAQSRIDFLAQAQALGYSTAQLQPYIASFGDMATAIARIPRNITVTANTDPAIQALNEFVAKAAAAGSAAGSAFGNGFNANAARMARGEAILAEISYLRGKIASGTGTVDANLRRLQALVNQYNSGSFASGGYTGNGGKYEPKGVVHGGEFVMTKKAVSNAGVGRMYAMMRAFETGRGYAMGGYVPTPAAVGGGGGIMGLSPQDRGLLRGILDGVQNFQPGYLPDEMISRASQRGDTKRKSMGELG